MQPAPLDATSGALPAPSAEARAHSERVVAYVASSIAAAGGWISFADYMGAALYAPGLGYYVSGTHKFGAGGDFVTAPELTPLFGQALASQLGEVLAQTGGDIIELGPGTGRLAADMLSALDDRDALPKRYRLLEVSPELRERQRAHLLGEVASLSSCVEWIEVLPERWRGVIIANEVLDAVPPHLIVRKQGAWHERGIAVEGESLALVDRPLESRALREMALKLFPAEGDYASEINPAAQALVTSLTQRCDAGALLLIDYGFPAAEYYHEQRSGGTLMAHYQHRALADPLFLPGLVDLTAHVDFTAMAMAAVSAGMHVGGFTTQAHFLINCGILDLLASSSDIRSAAYLREASAVNKLLSSAEMGELFKVLALTRGCETLLGFRSGDQRHRIEGLGATQ
jgi:SAM-dependent MidA family methyltransferase